MQGARQRVCEYLTHRKRQDSHSCRRDEQREFEEESDDGMATNEEVAVEETVVLSADPQSKRARFRTSQDEWHNYLLMNRAEPLYPRNLRLKKTVCDM